MLFRNIYLKDNVTSKYIVIIKPSGMEVGSQNVTSPGISKQIFKLKSPSKDGLILQIHHTVPGSCGEIRRIRFVRVAFDGGGEQLAASDHRGNIFIIDLAVTKFWLLTNVVSCTAIIFSTYKSNEILIGTQVGELLFINTEVGRITGKLIGHTVAATQISFYRDRFCLTASQQEAIIWDLQTNTQAHRLAIQDDVAVKQVLFMPVSNNILACFQNDTMHVWKFGTFECIKQILADDWKYHNLKSIAFTRNGRAMTVGGNSSTIVVFSLDNWSVHKIVKLHDKITGVKHLEFLPQLFDGGANKILCLLTSQGILHFLNVESSEFLPHIIGGDGVRNFTCSPSGKYVAAVLRSGEINVYTSSSFIEFSGKTEDVSLVYKPLVGRTNTKSEEVKKVVIKPPFTKHTAKTHLVQVQKEIQEKLDLQKLRPILKQFGEYPETYRVLIWKTILQLPQNHEAYMALVNRKCHPAYVNIEEQYPLENKAVLSHMKRLLSSLAHWCTLFGETKFIPLFAFPFVKFLHTDPLICFEIVVTIVVNWCQHWFEYHPFPPINVLAIIENMLAEHDADLLNLFYENSVTSQLYAWTLMEVAFSEVLSTSEWKQLWDHILSNEPSFLLAAVVAYNITLKGTLKTCQTLDDFEYFYHNQNPIDMKQFIKKTYLLLQKTGNEQHPRKYIKDFEPLPEEVYPVYNQYPTYFVKCQAQQMDHIRQEEEDIKQETQLALQLKIAQEKRLKEAKLAEIQETRLSRLEEAYRKTLLEEEEKIALKRQKVANLHQELCLREREFFDTTQKRFQQYHWKCDNISQKKLIPDSEVATPRSLSVQKKQLVEELKKIREETNSGQQDKKKKVGIATKVALVDNLLEEVEFELAKEIADRQSNQSSGLKTKEALMESETKSLEKEVDELIHKLRDLKVKIQSDNLTLTEEQNTTHRRGHISKNLRTTNGPDTTQNLYDKILEESILCQNKAPQKQGKSLSSRTSILKSDSETSSGPVYGTKSKYFMNKALPGPAVKSLENLNLRDPIYYRKQQKTIESSLASRENLSRKCCKNKSSHI